MTSSSNLGFLQDYIIKNNYNIPLNEILDDEDFQETLCKNDEILLK
jgi:hypothetical protein